MSVPLIGRMKGRVLLGFHDCTCCGCRWSIHRYNMRVCEWGSPAPCTELHWRSWRGQRVHHLSLFPASFHMAEQLHPGLIWKRWGLDEELCGYTGGVKMKNANEPWRHLSIYMFMCLFINLFACLFVYIIWREFKLKAHTEIKLQ